MGCFKFSLTGTLLFLLPISLLEIYTKYYSIFLLSVCTENHTLYWLSIWKYLTAINVSDNCHHIVLALTLSH